MSTPEEEKAKGPVCDFSSAKNLCGPSKRVRGHIPSWENQEIRKFIINADGSNYGLQTGVVTSEAEVILQRSGKRNTQLGDIEKYLSLQICPLHRERFTTKFYFSKFCQYPDHDVKSKESGYHAISFKVASDIEAVCGMIIPVGLKICRSCNKILDEKVNNISHDGAQELATDSSYPPIKTRDFIKKEGMSRTAELFAAEKSESSVASSSQSNYTPSQPEAVNPLEVLNSSMESLAKLQGKHWTPINFQCHQPLESLGSTAKWKLRRSFDEGLSIIAEALNPGYGSQLIEHFTEQQVKSIQSSGNTKEAEMDTLQDLRVHYDRCPDPRSRRYLVKIMAQLEKPDGSPKYKVREIARMFNVSRWLVNECRQEPSVIKEVVKHTRMKLDQQEAQNFIEFCIQRLFLQASSWGTQKVKFDSGFQETIGLAVQTVATSDMIEAYHIDARERDRKAISARTCYRIAHLIFPGKKSKSIAGLDTVYDSGNKALDKIKDILGTVCDESETAESIKAEVEEVRYHLKSVYKGHIQMDRGSTVPDHCPRFSLTPDDEEAKCGHIHDHLCKSCEQIPKLFKEIEELAEAKELSEESSNEIRYEISTVREEVMHWKAHVMRTIVQSKAKSDAMLTLNDHSGLLIFDWSMKILPTEYRESSADWFGKRGISLFGAVLFEKDINGGIKKSAYMAFADSCSQDSRASLAFYDCVLRQIKKDKPHITELYNKSDNAGCFHSWDFITGIQRIGRNLQIIQKRLDFNEPCSGKDQVDREFGVIKQKFRSLLNRPGARHKTATDLKKSLDSAEKRLKGVKFAVIQIPQERKENATEKRPTIAGFHSFEYVTGGIRKFRYYGLDEGEIHSKLIAYATPRWDSLMEFDDGDNTVVLKENQHMAEQDLIRPFLCTEPGCGLTFGTRDEEELHQLQGKHSFEEQKETPWDHLRRTFIAAQDGRTTAIASERMDERDNLYATAPAQAEQGWAIPKSKRGFKMSKEQREFLVELFEEGMKSRSSRVDGDRAVELMRSARNIDGSKRFQPKEYLKASQCTSFFARLFSQAKRKGSGISSGEELLEENDIDSATDGKLTELEAMIRDETLEDYVEEAMKKLDGRLDLNRNDFVFLKGEPLRLGRVSRFSENSTVYVEIMSFDRDSKTYSWPRIRSDVPIEDADFVFSPRPPKRVAKGKQSFRLHEEDQAALDRLEEARRSSDYSTERRFDRGDDSDSDPEMNPPKRSKAQYEGSLKSSDTEKRQEEDFSQPSGQQESSDQKQAQNGPILVENSTSMPRCPYGMTCKCNDAPGIIHGELSTTSIWPASLYRAASERQTGARERLFLKYPWTEKCTLVQLQWSPILLKHEFFQNKIPNSLPRFKRRLLEKIQSRRHTEALREFSLFEAEQRKEAPGRPQEVRNMSEKGTSTSQDSIGVAPKLGKKHASKTDETKEKDSRKPSGGGKVKRIMKNNNDDAKARSENTVTRMIPNP